jgi:hypothetical protein
MSINTIEDLQNIVLKNIELLDKDKVDINKCSIIAKGAEAVFSSLRLQIQYSALRNESPNVSFLQKNNKGEANSLGVNPKKISFGIK